MQFADRKLESVAPDRSGAATEVKQPDADVILLPLLCYCSVDRIIQLLPLKNVVAQKTCQRPLHRRDGADHVEPAKPRQCGRYFMAERKRQVLLVFAVTRIE